MSSLFVDSEFASHDWQARAAEALLRAQKMKPAPAVPEP
jgi:hypothetical protein